MRRAAGLAVRTFALLLALLLAPVLAHAERRVALVVGNAAYQHAAPLKNPAQDAAAVSDVLRRLDFNVTTVTDLDKIGMERAVRRFAADIDGADVALFYYSGHAVQVGDRNYLVPVSATVEGARTLSLDTLALQDVSALMRDAGAKVQLLFLDACRDNPFAGALNAGIDAGTTRGLARIDTATGSLVVFSTSPGEVALDGAGALSPFSDAFSRYAATPKLEIRQVLTRVRADVAAATGDRQVPWDNSSLLGDFYLVPPRAPPVFDHLARVAVAQDSAPQPLHLAAPVQPEGGALALSIVRLPAAGTLLLGRRPVAENDPLLARDFTALAYAGTGPAQQDAFSFKVEDAWGNQDIGLVSISRLAGPGAAVASNAPPTPAPAVADVAAEAVSLVGLGPNLIFRKPGDIAQGNGEQRIQLASNLPFGQIVLGDRVIEKGRSIGVADLRHLAFIPPVGSEGKHVDAVFKPLDAAGGEVRVGIDVEIADCDRLAGDRLDPQGVADGVLSGQIDIKAALPACETAVKARPTSARFLYELGRVYAALSRNPEAGKLFHQAADLGHVRALWALGYLAEYTAPIDEAQGKAILERAAAAGDVYAVHTLGTLYYDGRGVEKDLAKAKALFENAARVGHTFSMNALGRMYQRGETVQVDLAMTRRYWEESAARGDIYGLDNMGFVYLDGIDVDKDPLKALDYFKKAAALDHPEAPNNIGRMYILGIGVPVDYAEGRKWDGIGADRGDAWAAWNLAELDRLGHGGPVDLVASGYYDARAAGSVNRLEPSDLGRTQLAGLDRRLKPKVMRRLLADLDPSAGGLSDAALPGLAAHLLATKGVRPADGSVDATLIALAQAGDKQRNMRTDLF